VITIKFQYGDEIDKAVVKVIMHEFSRCEIAFNSFIISGPKSLSEFEKPSRTSNVIRYNSYALFIQHLYEYLVACAKRDLLNTNEINFKVMENYILVEVNKILKNMLWMIDNNKAPSWVNARSYYENECPLDFPRDFRQIRNSHSHADYRRIKGDERITLSEFYLKYHKYISLLFQSGLDWWRVEDFEHIDLGEVTEFNRIIWDKE